MTLKPQTGSAGGTSTLAPLNDTRELVICGYSYRSDPTFPVGFTTENDICHCFQQSTLLRSWSASQTIRSGPRRQGQHAGVPQHHHAHLHVMLGTETAPNLRTWHAPQRACITIQHFVGSHNHDIREASNTKDRSNTLTLNPTA